MHLLIRTASRTTNIHRQIRPTLPLRRSHHNRLLRPLPDRSRVHLSVLCKAEQEEDADYVAAGV